MATLSSAPLPAELAEAERNVQSLCAAFLQESKLMLMEDGDSEPTTSASDAAVAATKTNAAVASLRQLTRAVRQMSHNVNTQEFASSELEKLKETNSLRVTALKDLLHSLDSLIDQSWRSIISYHEAAPQDPRDISARDLIAYASRIRTNIFDGMGVLPSQPPAPQMWHMQNSAWSHYTNTLLAQAADEYKNSASKKEVPVPAPHPAAVMPANPLSAFAMPPDWKPGDPLPIPPSWKPGDPLPPVAIPPGWQPGDPLPIPGWKPGDPIPPLPFPAGWKPGDPLPTELPSFPAPAAPSMPETRPEAGEVPVPNKHMEIDWLLNAEEVSSEDYSDDED